MLMIKLSERIKFVREKLGISQSVLAKELGLESPMAISSYESGKTEPDTSKLIKLSKMANVTLDWLLTGEGEMKRGEGGEKPLIAAEPAVTYGPRDAEVSEIVQWVKENPTDKKLILKLIKSRKLAKEAFEGFGVKGLVEEG